MNKDYIYESYIYNDTSNTSNSMKMYLKEIEKYKMLSFEDELKLSKEIQNSSKDAKETLHIIREFYKTDGVGIFGLYRAFRIKETAGGVGFIPVSNAHVR